MPLGFLSQWHLFYIYLFKSSISSYTFVQGFIFEGILSMYWFSSHLAFAIASFKYGLNLSYSPSSFFKYLPRLFFLKISLSFFMHSFLPILDFILIKCNKNHISIHSLDHIG